MGHAGTLDPFATGLLLLLSGRSTKLAGSFVGLDKRYLTDVDLTSRTTTGDPEGDVVGRQEAPSPDELERALEALRGEIELPIPAASAVKIGGERAYKLHRRGVEVEMPLRRSRVDALDVIAYTDGIVTLDLRVSSGTYVRAIAEALGGHCVALRRLEVGPFSVEDADEERVIPRRAGAGAAAVSTVEKPFAVAIGTFDGVHLGHRRVIETALGTGSARPGADLPAASARRPRQLRRGARDARAPARAARRARRRRDDRGRVHARRRPAGAGGVRRRAARGRGGRRRGRGLPLRSQAPRRPRAARTARATRCCPCRCWRASPRPRSGARCTRATCRRPRGCSGARRSWTGSSSAATSAAARSATRRRTSRSSRGCSCPAYGIYAGAALGHRAAISIGTNPHYGGEERRIEPYLLDFDGDLYGRRLVVELWERLRDEQVFESEQELIDQIARDVEATRKAVRPA